jgi:hypothetical protein
MLVSARTLVHQGGASFVGRSKSKTLYMRGWGMLQKGRGVRVSGEKGEITLVLVSLRPTPGSSSAGSHRSVLLAGLAPGVPSV